MIFRYALVAFLIAFSNLVFARTPVTPDATVRTSSMNRDVLINATLFNALTSSATSVPLITVSIRKDGQKVVTLASGGDVLECIQAGCNISWDNVSANAIQASAAFENSLFESLYRWALGDGKNDPALRFVKYPTGNISIKVTEDNVSQDQVSCIELDPNGAGEFKKCSFAVSEMQSGTSAELRQKYVDLMASQSVIDQQKQALLTTVSTGDFLHEGNTDNGNGIYTVEHKLYTDILVDAVNASLNYGYKNPIKDSSGRIISHGINIELNANQYLDGKIWLESVNAHSYVLAHRP